MRRGYTTGMCAAAAAKAATLLLFTGSAGEAVEVTTPRGVKLVLPLCGVERGKDWSRACVVKDAGDDPDVTHGLRICAEARPAPEGIHLAGGPGVGVVTKPGLAVPVGEPAINPVPREVIRREVGAVLPPGRGVRIAFSVPGGEEVARRTFNPRLGIVGGISILGTTGIVEPMSEEAWKESLVCQVKVAVASGHRTLVLVPARTGERVAVERYGFPPAAVVQTANFVGHVLRACAEEGATGVLLFGYHGKLVKLAAGCFNTHSRVADARLETLAALAAARGAGAEVVAEILDCVTAEAALEVLKREALLEVIDDAAERAAARARSFVEERLAVGVVLVDRAGNVLGRDSGAAAIAGRLGVRLPDPVRPAPEPGLYVVGVGPGSPDYLVPAARRVIAGARVLAGRAETLAFFARPGRETVELKGPLEPLIERLAARAGNEPVALLVSGDPGVYSLLGSITRRLPGRPVKVVPGISAVQLAFARLGLPWEDARILTVHGRGPGEELARAVAGHPKVAVLTDPRHSPAAVAAYLAARGLGHRPAFVLNNLSLKHERVWRGRLEELAACRETFDNAVLVILDAAP